MSDSLLVEALGETRRIVTELAWVPEVRCLNARVGLLERATAMLELRPAPVHEVVKLAKLVLDIRDEACSLRTTFVIREATHQMMD